MAKFFYPTPEHLLTLLINPYLQRSAFATPGRSIVTVLTMTTGDFEYDSIFRQHTEGTPPEEVPPDIPFPTSSYILWIFFLIFMPILLTNLLVNYK